MGDLFGQFEAIWAVSGCGCGFMRRAGFGGWVDGFAGSRGCAIAAV